MKYLYFLLFTVFFSFQIQAQNVPFVTTWKVTSNSLNIAIPTFGTGYDYTVDFGDGTVQYNVTGNATHTYSQPGVYSVSISGDFPRIYFNSGNVITSQSNSYKISSVEQWGDIQWQSMERAFKGCVNLVINATDIPDLSQVINMSHMFDFNLSLNQPLDNWDVSSATDMSSMFKNANTFNQPLNNWDVSNVINMSGMFSGDGIIFNQPLDNWDVSNVTDMSKMFSGAYLFDQPLNIWDVSNVTNMTWMFEAAFDFNQPLNNWNVSNVLSMDSMFQLAISFNQPLNNWNVSNVTLMESMFRNAQSFNQDISNWQINVSDLSLFLTNSGLDISNYDALLTKLATLGLNNGTLGADGLEYCNLAARSYLVNVLGWTINGDSLDVNGCSLNKVQGNILYDLNNNGCDPNDIPADTIIINASDGTNDYAAISDINGDYTLYLLDDTYTIGLLNLPNYFTATPVTSTVNFVGFNNVEIEDFCLTANQSIEDLNITLLPTGQARPGFESDYRLVVRNVGTETIANVEATLEFDDQMQQFVVANPAPGSTTANTLTFPLGTIQPFQTVEIDITMLSFPPPTVNGDDILNFIATITPVVNDHTPNDNIYNIAQVVVNSYDPNDKQVLQGEELHIDDVGDYLDYLIRFQNTGSASAINVRILDTLHPKLDWNTLIPISASHDYYVKITEGNRVEFMFDNIHLLDSISNEPASHGYIAYKIKPKSNVQVGDVISGDAAIYFDFNAPIITNIVYTLIVEPQIIIDDSNPLNRLVLYPNPTNKTLHIHLTEGMELQEVLIYDMQGKKVQKFQGKETTVEVENLSSGVYLLKIKTNQGTINRQLIKN